MRTTPVHAATTGAPPLAAMSLGLSIVLGVAGCGASPSDSPHPPGAGARVEPQVGGQFTLRRGMFSPGMDPSSSEQVNQSSFRGVSLGDCNGDGLVDVYDPLDGRIYAQRAGGTYAPVAQVTGPNRFSAAVFVDLPVGDAGPDGNEDLVVGDDQIWVLQNRGDCQFAAPRAIAPTESGWAGHLLVRDLDSDGLADLTVNRGNSSDSPYRLLIARGDGNFDDATPPPTPSAQPSPEGYFVYGAWFDDVDGDGAPDLFAMLDSGESWFAWGVPGESPALVRDEKLSGLLSLASPMGLSQLDADRDGRIDYFLAIGKSRLFWNRGPRDLVDIGDYAGIRDDSGMDHWGALAFDADLDGWSDLLVLRLKDGEFTPGHIGLFLNRHDASFTDVGAAVFGGAKLQAEALVCGDLQSDGKVSCFTREPAGHVLLENQLTPSGRWIGVRLRGTVSSADATGARVSLDGESRPLVVEVGGQAPAWGEHRRDVLLAIGDRTEGAVTITWPSGLVQKVAGLRAGSYTTVIEPRALSVSQRVVPADGKTLVDVIADPAAASGEVAIDRLGAGVWQGPATLGADGKWTRTLVAPAQPGIARITLTVDGKPLIVRPRVRFTAH